jgi:two-component system, NtrC family, response regulator GlrR
VSQTSVLILDLALVNSLSETLRGILESSGRMNVSLHCQERVGPNGKADCHSDLADAITRRLPDLCFLVFSSELLKQTTPLYHKLKVSLNGIPTIAVTDAGESDEILELLKLGVADFITLPLRPFDIYPRVWRLLQDAQREDHLKRTLKERLGLKQLVGESPAFLEQIEKISIVAKTNASVLILGETGTGKELCARAIHYLSPRARFPFVPVNCSAIPHELVENELFGHEPCAFTGAATAKSGLIREAHGGTLLLDEIDSLPLQTQAKLLRFLQEKEYRPLGSTKTAHADVRVIAASNCDLEERVCLGKLRQDLYYRLTSSRSLSRHYASGRRIFCCSPTISPPSTPRFSTNRFRAFLLMRNNYFCATTGRATSGNWSMSSSAPSSSPHSRPSAAAISRSLAESRTGVRNRSRR